jgi:hypothetical protein
LPGKDPEKALTRSELDAVRGRLASASGQERLDLILDAPDPGALVRALPADELYFTIREVGLADAVELVQLASARQFRVFLDLDGWRNGHLDPSRVLPWLRAARVGALQEPKKAAQLARKMRALDQELIFLLLRGAIRIHDLRADDDPLIESEEFLKTPDNQYAVEFLVEGTEYVAIRGLLEDLEAEDPFKLSRLMAALTWELPSDLEETALRWRQGRLADLGYPTLEEALSWYARPPAGPSQPPGHPDRAPGFFLAPLAGGSLLSRAAATLGPDDRRALELQLVTASNAVLVADGIDPADVERLRGAVEGARAMVELGLARLAGEDLPRAAELLLTVPVKRLFQEGFVRVLELSWRADRLWKSGTAGRRAAPLLDAPLGEAMAALSGRRPRFHPGLELPRAAWGTAAAGSLEPRRFLTAGELATAASALGLCEGLAALGARLGLTPTSAEGDVPRLSVLYATALANERLGRGFAPLPLRPGDLGAAAEALAGITDARLANDGEAGVLLLELARRRGEELAAVLDRTASQPGLVRAVLVQA